jgi:putative transposase
MQLRYSYRIYPTLVQREALARAFGCVRVVFNDALAARRAAFKAGEKFPPDKAISARLTQSKRAPEREWLNEVSSVVLQQSLADLSAAYSRFFGYLKALREWSAAGRKGPKPRRVGPPQFKSRKDRRQSVRFTANSKFKLLGNGRLRLPKVGDVEVRLSRALPSAASSVTVIKDRSGRYFAPFVVEVSPSPLPETDRDCGIDLGLGHFAVLDDGTKVSAPRFLRQAEKKIRKAQRVYSRRQKGSSNKDKARVKVARVHAKVTDARKDFHHKLSTQIIRENQAVYVENLCVTGLARTRLAKSVHDAGWGSFTRMLEYKAQLYGRGFHRIGRWEPTSQVCSACGVKDGPKPLKVREWQCAACGTVHDRDINAAKNIAALGRREAQNACGGGVRPQVVAIADETGSHRSAA